jgi:D-glycero-D-manno-heptose 1,7-bisphosphate phosphatase
VKPAVFFDRDGTLIELVHHLTDPADVRLIAGAGDAVRELRGRGFACVLVTNQSAIGRGLLTEAGLGEVQAEFAKQLAAFDAQIDGFYFCPVKPTVDDPTVIEHPDRKPGPGMLLRASRELGLDLSRSWMVGDTISDLLAGRNAGCRATILVRTGYGARVSKPGDYADHVADDAWSAARLILESGEAERFASNGEQT